MTKVTHDANYYQSKYGLSATHNEVVQACGHIKPCKVLDLGAGNGRNALYLSARGFDVTAADSNPDAVAGLKSIIAAEGINNIDARVYDINEASLNAQYDFIVGTVVLMFLDPSRIAAVVGNMQQATSAGGYNLIVAAMDTEPYPCPVNFPFTLAEGQLRDYYAGWEFIKYNEDLGTMHNGMQLQFATMVAQKNGVVERVG